MIRSIHPDDAFAFIVQTIRQGQGAQPGAGHGHEVWVPDIVWRYLVGEGYNRNQQSDFYYDAELDDLWRGFYDALWRLCRMGILRPGPPVPRLASSGSPVLTHGYSCTSQGRTWLKTADLVIVPTDPARYVAVLSREANRLGEGFVQRAREAASCHQTSNYLACCAMCGAAAESAILRAAIAKDQDERRVLREYARPGWRKSVIRKLFGENPNRLEENFVRTAFELLAYWRDETAHGRAYGVSEIEAYHSLTVLLRFAQFLFDRWDTFSSSSHQ